MSTPLRILSIEDHPDDTELNILALTQGGYDPIWKRVETPEALRQALRDEEWDIILCDFYLPEMDAFIALEIYHASGLDTPFIIVSGSAKDETMAEAMRLGANDYVFKDRIEKLVPSVQREIKSAEERRQKKILQDEFFKTGEKSE